MRGKASPAHIASLVRAPLRKRRGRTSPFAFTSCHSERSEESPPFAERKGARGMLTVQQLPVHPPFAERKGARGMLAFARTSITTSNMWYQLLQTRFRR